MEGMPSAGNKALDKVISSPTSGGIRKGKPTYCWNFNKGIKCRFGDKCRFTERCSYCDSPAHGIVACPKLDKKDKESIMKKNLKLGDSNEAGKPHQ